MKWGISEKSRSIPRSGIRRIYDEVLKYKDVVNLSAGEPDASTPKHVNEAAFKAINDGYTHYTPNAGLEEFREAAADKVKRENNIEADPDVEVIATPGAMGALSLAAYVTINSGDEVLIADPGYVSYPAHILIAGGIPVPVPVYEADNFALRSEEIKKRVTKRTKVIILNYPNNPTGSTLSKTDLEDICDVILENNLFVIADEVYEHILYDDNIHYSIASLLDMKKKCVSIYSLSKSYAMTGWRIGYAVGGEDVIHEMTKIQEHMSSHPSAISQKAAIAALTGPQNCIQKLVDQYSRRKETMYKRVNEIEGLSCIKPKGAFYIFANIKDLGRSSYDTSMFFLRKSRVATVPGSEFGSLGEGYLRLSYSVSEETIEKGMNRIAETVKTIK